MLLAYPRRYRTNFTRGATEPQRQAIANETLIRIVSRYGGFTRSQWCLDMGGSWRRRAGGFMLPDVRLGRSLFCSSAVLDPRIFHTMDVLSPFIPVLCHSDWLPLRVLCTSWCCPSRPCVAFLAFVHLALFFALSLSPGNSLASSLCDQLASLLWRCDVIKTHDRCVSSKKSRSPPHVTSLRSINIGLVLQWLRVPVTMCVLIVTFSN